MSVERRDIILEHLKVSGEPITGSALAEMLGVSRQVIVQDIAVLRAKGNQILATSNGYTLPDKPSKGKIIKTIISKHNGIAEMSDELMIIVEYGGKIIDVVIDHPVYGEIVGLLHISTKEEVDKFIERVKETHAKPLATLTEGDHIHTLEVPSEKVFMLMLKELKDKGYVA